MKKFYFVYVLRSLKDSTTYIGSSEDIFVRLDQHNAGKTKSIKHKIPYEIVYYEAYLTKTQALKRERQLKTNSKAKEFLFERLFGL